MTAERVQVIVEGDADDLRAALRGASADLKLFGATAESQSRRTDRLTSSIDRQERGFVGLGTAVSRTNSSFSLLRNTFATLKLPAMIGAAGAGAEGLTALAGGAVSLTSALAPLTGSLVAFPALMGSLGQAAGVVALAGVDDLTEALGGNEDALKRLNPQGQELVRTLEDLEPRYRRLQTTAQEPLFQSVNRGIADAMNNFPALNAVVRETSEELADLIEQGGRFVGREGFGSDFRTVASGNVELIDHLGQAGFNFADALRHVMVEAQPLLSWMGRGVESFSEFVEAEAKAGRKSGDLAEFFGETRQAMHRVVDIGGSLFNVLMDIGAASKPFGEDYLVTIRNAADAMERFTGSVEGQEALGNFFAESDRKLREMAETIEDILDEGSLADSIARAIELAVPEIAEHAGEIGVAIAEGLAKGFVNADLAGKIFSAAAFIRLVGGSGALWKVGAAIGSKIGLGVLGPLGLGIAAGQIIDSLFPRKLDDMVADVVDAVVEQFQDMRSDVVPPILRVSAAVEQMGAGVAITKKDFRTAAEGADFFADALDETADRLRAFERMVDRKMDDVGGATKDAGKVLEDFADDASKSFEKVTGSSGRMAKGVGGNSASMVNAVADGLRTFSQNVNEALSAFQVKKVSYSIKDVGKNVGNVVGAQKGAIVPGSGSGDTVPLHVGGQLAAMVEPGEQVSVLNRKATQRLMDYNAAVPRFAGGGLVTGDTDYVPALGDALESMAAATNRSIYVQSGRRTMAEQQALYNAYLNGTGNLAAVPNANAPHVRGIAADITPGREVFGSAAGKFGLGFTVPSESWHIELLNAVGAAARGGAQAVKIARLLLQGPDGPPKRLGQAGLDKALKGARAFVASKAPTSSGGFGGFGDASGSGKKLMQEISRQRGWNFADWWALDAAETSHGANLVNPTSTARLRGQFLDMNWGKYGPGSDPAQNPTMAQQIVSMARYIEERYGNPTAAWSWHQAHNWYQHGGIVGVPHLAGGGKPDTGSMTNVPSGLIEARKIARKLRNLTGGSGTIAKLDERLQIAQTLADADGVLSESEVARQLRLQRSLLGDLRGADRLSKAGYRWASKAGGPGRNLRSLFRETQLEMEGVTGKGGRIFDTRRAIADLRGADTGPDLSGLNGDLAEQLRVSQLTSALSEAQFSTFRGFLDEFKSQMPFVGSFDHGVARVERTGFARVHKGEGITPDPQGPFVNTLAPARGPSEVTVYVDGDAEPMIKRIRAEIDGRAAKVVNRQLGRRSRQLATAPGR